MLAWTTSSGAWNVSRRVGAASLGLLLAACAVERAARQADELIELHEEYASAPVEAAQVLPLAEALDAPELTKLLEGAFTRNMDLRAAWARVTRAEAAAGEARASRLPGVQASLEAERTNTPTLFGLEDDLEETPDNGFPELDFSPSTANRFTGSFGASYEIDAWGRLGAAHRAARLEADGARRDAEALAVSLAAEVTEAWAALGAGRERLSILDGQLRTSERILELTRLRFRQGLVDAQDVAQQAQQTEAIGAQRVLAEREVSASTNRLAVLMGQAPGAAPEVTVEELPRPLPMQDPGRPGQLLDRRPDVRAARLRLESADERTAAAVAERLPRLMLTPNIFDQAQQVANLFSDVFWSIGGAAEHQLFLGGAREAAITGAEADAQARLYEYGQTLLEALQDVEDALTFTQLQERHVESLDRQLSFARTALDAGLRRYRQGDVDFISVLIDLQTANSVELDLLTARHELFSSRVQLWRALGGDWQRRSAEEDERR